MGFLSKLYQAKKLKLKYLNSLDNVDKENFPPITEKKFPRKKK